jgi:hypothetical protein
MNLPRGRSGYCWQIKAEYETGMFPHKNDSKIQSEKKRLN